MPQPLMPQLQPMAPSAGMSMGNVTFFDRGITQSPIPVWEEGAELAEMELDQEPTEGYMGAGLTMAGVGGMEGEDILDPDGVVIRSSGDIPTEPNSPDKLTEGIPLPER